MMEHAYEKFYLAAVRRKLSGLFRLALERESMDIDEFMKKFISSGMARKFETANPKYVLGMSEPELLREILGRELSLEKHETWAGASWTGYVLGYAQWELNMPYKDITDKFPCSELAKYAFRSEGEAIPKIMKVIEERLGYEPPLTVFREKAGYTRAQLAACSNIRVESIISFETGERDISCAEAYVVYSLAKALDCTVEDLIC